MIAISKYNLKNLNLNLSNNRYTIINYEAIKIMGEGLK